MLRSQLQSATALAEAGNGKSSGGVEGLLARKRFGEGSASPTRPRKKALLRHTSPGLLSSCNALRPFPSISSSSQSSSSSCPNSALHGSIRSPPYQPYDFLSAGRENKGFVQAPAPTLDAGNAVAALNTPPSEDTGLHDCYQPAISYDRGSLPAVDGPLLSDAAILAPPAWPTTLDQLPYSSLGNAYSQVPSPNIEEASSYTADLIAFGHLSSPSTTSSGLSPETTLTGYQNFPATILSEHHLQFCAAQATSYDVLGQTGFRATPQTTVPSFNFEVPLYQTPVFGDQTTATSLMHTFQGPAFDQELPFLLTQGSGSYQNAIKKLSPSDSVSSDEESLALKKSQSPESRDVLDEVSFKTEQPSPPQTMRQQPSLDLKMAKPSHGFPTTTQGTFDNETMKSSPKHQSFKTKMDPNTELQLVYQCFNSHGRSFALVPERLDNCAPQTKPAITTQVPKARKPLGEDERQETSRTRDVGACVRCKIQRVRCKPNLDEPEGPCLACIKVARNKSQKRIHNIGCHRYKLQELSLFRTERLRFTKRWQGAQIRDVATFGEPVTIWIDQGLARPWPITVRRYDFDRADPRTIVARRWLDPHGAYREQSDYPYALASVNETKDWYREYITVNKFAAYSRVMSATTSGPRQDAVCDTIVKDVCRLAHENHYALLPVGAKWNFYRPPEKLDVKQISEENFMSGIFEMWFAMRQSTGSSHVKFGDTGLDPAEGDVKPGSGWTALTGLSTPKMVVGQFNSINITCVLRPLAKVLLKVLMSWITDRHYHRWMSIFYATFIILREIAHTTLDAYRHGARNPERDVDSPLKPNWSENIVELHESANIILAHWHYFNCSTDPTKLSEKTKSKSPLKQLNDDQLRTVQDIWSRVTAWKGSVPQAETSSDGYDWPAWCEPMYFAAQMFDIDWRPLPVFHG